jgi:predicted nucleic acid-binding Zn ribbon protein
MGREQRWRCLRVIWYAAVVLLLIAVWIYVAVQTDG